MTDIKNVAKPVLKGLGLKKVLKSGFAGGILGAVAINYLSSKSARDLAVKGLAKGMNLKDSAQEKFASIKEEAEILHAEAKLKAKKDRLADETQHEMGTEE